VHVERAPCVHPPYCPTPTPRLANWVRILSHRREDRAPPCDLPTSYITSRASIGECAPPHAAQEPNNRDLSKQLGPSVPAYLACGPRHCCTSTVVRRARRSRCNAEGGVQSKGGGGCERAHSPACSGTVLGWVGVYSVTGCTAYSSRVESGAWWWHCAYLRRLLPRAAARHTHHTARAVLSAGTSTNTGGRWHADTR
jgi:hypothetical protein